MPCSSGVAKVGNMKRHVEHISKVEQLRLSLKTTFLHMKKSTMSKQEKPIVAAWTNGPLFGDCNNGFLLKSVRLINSKFNQKKQQKLARRYTKSCSMAGRSFRYCDFLCVPARRDKAKAQSSRPSKKLTPIRTESNWKTLISHNPREKQLNCLWGKRQGWKSDGYTRSPAHITDANTHSPLRSHAKYMSGEPIMKRKFITMKTLKITQQLIPNTDIKERTWHDQP